MVALAIGGEDFIADLKTTRTKSGTELFVARGQLILAARAAGIQAIDTVFSDVSDDEGLFNVIVTEYGIAVNPRRKDVLANLQNKGLLLKSIEELQEIAYSLAGTPEDIPVSDEIVGIVEYRDGTILDVIRRPL